MIESVRAFYAEEAERSVLGSMLRSERALKDAAFLSERDFYSPANGKIFAAMRLLEAQKRPVDITTVDEQLSKMGVLAAVGGTAYLIELAGGTPSAANARAYAERVKEAALMREVCAIGEQLTRDAADPMTDIGLLVDGARAKLREIAMPGVKYTTLAEAALHEFEELEREAKGEVKSYSYGIAALDKRTGGMRRGELINIGALTSVGKTSLGYSVALHNGHKGIPVCYISLEMTSGQLARRAFSNVGQVDGMKLRVPKTLTSDDWDRLGAALPVIGETRVNQWTESNYVEDVRMFIQNMVDIGECELAVIDYVQLLDTKRRTGGDTERVGYCSRLVKRMTIEFNIPIITLSQMNRGPAQGGKIRIPRMSELRSSGQLEQDADTVMILHRPEDTSDETVKDAAMFNTLQDKGMQYMVGDFQKQRGGATGRVRFGFDPAHMSYFEV
jgi:replicative DNA helicase